MNSLTSEQTQQFINDGFLILRGCFSREAAQPLVDEAWKMLGYDRHDRGTWKKPLAFLYPESRTSLRELSPLLWNAICHLTGNEDRWPDGDYGIGQWVINLTNGCDEPWMKPGPAHKGWHIDGNYFRHFLDSPEQGLVIVPLFSDVLPRGGGTIFAADSIPVIARFLLAHPEGVLPREIPYKDLLSECHDYREITGEIGDVVLFHPFMLHASAQNHRPEARFITNIGAGLREPMRFDKPAPLRSPVEIAILRGLGVEQLNFQIQHARERIDP